MKGIDIEFCDRVDRNIVSDRDEIGKQLTS